MIAALRTMYRSENNWDIVALSRRVMVGSALALLVCAASLVLRGLNLGIEFRGGAVWEVPALDGVSTDDMSGAAADAGVPDARVQLITGGEDIFRIRGELVADDEGAPVRVAEALAGAAGVSVDEVSARTVSPSFGDEVAGKARRALVVFFALIAAYLWARFEWKMSLAALIAVGHDIVLTVGLYALAQFEVTPSTVVAFLTIMGYSLYDTIVVFDRVKDNERALGAKSRVTYRALANVSLNQVLMRSVNTTVTSVLPVLSLLVVGSVIMGATSLQEFAIALLIGLLVGSFSSVFVAMPVVTFLKSRELHWAELARAATLADQHTTLDSAVTALAADHYTRSTAPRPRKLGRRR